MTDYDSIWRTQDGSQGSGTVLHISDVRSSHNMMFILLIWEECYKTHFISCAAPIFCVPLHLEKIRIFIHRFIIYFYFARCEARKLIVRFVKNTRHSAKFGELFFVFMADSKYNRVGDRQIFCQSPLSFTVH